MKAIRTLPDPGRKILDPTFDDGPHRGSTEPVLESLGRHGIHATFFVIAEKAQKEVSFTREIQSAGHAIGNHSLDHRYSRFFGGRRALREWIATAETNLSQVLGEPTVGFRPPAGVRTPELHKALKEIRMPLILWNTRFYDAVFPWTVSRAMKSVGRARSGDIVLLHDRQEQTALPSFIKTLDCYLSEAKAAGFEFGILTREKMDRLNRSFNNLSDQPRPNR